MEQFGQFIINNWLLWLALFIIIGLIIFYELYDMQKRPKSLSPSELIQKINNEDITIFDIRSTDAFKQGHIIHSKNITVQAFTEEMIQTLKDKPFVLVCQRGTQVQTLTNKLKQEGCKQPMFLQGGVTAWQQANLPLIKK